MSTFTEPVRHAGKSFKEIADQYRQKAIVERARRHPSTEGHLPRPAAIKALAALLAGDDKPSIDDRRKAAALVPQPTGRPIPRNPRRYSDYLVFLPRVRELAAQDYGAYKIAAILRKEWSEARRNGEKRDLTYPTPGFITRMMAAEGVDLRGRHPTSPYFNRMSPPVKASR